MKLTNFTLSSLIVLATCTFGLGQTPQQQQDFVQVLGARIQSASDAEIARARAGLIQPTTLEQQSEQTRMRLFEQVSKLTAQIECLQNAISSAQRTTPRTDLPGMQRINALTQQFRQSTQQFNNLALQLTNATNASTTARDNRIQAERAAAALQAKNTQQMADMGYLYTMWRQTPQGYTWDALYKRLLEVGGEKRLTSTITISTGGVRANVGYQLGDSGRALSIDNCTGSCSVTLPVGSYKFWIANNGDATPVKKPLVVFRDTHTIDVSPPPRTN